MNSWRLWVYLQTTPLFWLTATLAAFLVADALSKRARRHPLVNPVLIAVAFIAALLKLTGTPYKTYFDGAQFVHFLLGPATVALGVTAGLLGLLVVAFFASGLWGQGWNGIPGDYRAVPDQGVTGFLPAARFAEGDGPRQLVDQLAGIGAIGGLAFTMGWLVFLVMSVPYRLREERRAS